MSTEPTPTTLPGLRPLTGRDPHEQHPGRLPASANPVGSIALTPLGVGTGACMIAAMLAPVVSVVGFEILRRRDPNCVAA